MRLVGPQVEHRGAFVDPVLVLGLVELVDVAYRLPSRERLAVVLKRGAAPEPALVLLILPQVVLVVPIWRSFLYFEVLFITVRITRDQLDTNQEFWPCLPVAPQVRGSLPFSGPRFGSAALTVLVALAP